MTPRPLAAAFLSLALLVPAARAAPRIVNGVETQSRPTTGALLARSGEYYSHICTGTLIGCQTFLTAGHCVCPGDTSCVPNANGFGVYLQHGGVVNASAISVHPAYQFGVASDIAVVTLASPIDGIPPTPINTTMNPPHATAGSIAGFGITQGGRNDSGLLREGDVETGSCGASFDPVPEPAHVCWQFLTPLGAPGTDSNTCSGDSGGPLFVDFGGGEVVAGVTSGGDAFDCMPTDVSFDANVFQNTSFIQTIGGTDLLNTTCGSGSQVGDVDTEIVAVSSAQADRSVVKCRRSLRKLYERYTAAVLGARAACIDDVGSGIGTPPCPDADATKKVSKAASKVDAARIGRKCPAAVIAEIGASGECAGADEAAALGTCIVTAGDAAVAAMLDIAYADDAPAGPIADATCQLGAGRAAARYQKSSLKAFDKCESSADKGKVDSCPDTKATQALTKERSKLGTKIAQTCTNEAVAALDAAATFGGSCAGVTTAGQLADCVAGDFDVESETLVALFEPAVGTGLIEITVPADIDVLRIALNGLDTGATDVDLYVREGAPPTTSVFDASSFNGGVFDSVDIASPTTGQWFVLVHEFAGKNVPVQVTVTMFKS